MILESEFPPDIRVENEIESLLKAGHEIHLACFTKISQSEFEKYNGYFIHRKKISGFLYKSSVACLRFPIYFNFWKKFLKKLFSKYDFEAIHIHDLPMIKVGVVIKNEFNIPLIIDLHENFPAAIEVYSHTNTILGKILSPAKLWHRYELKYLKKADTIITVVDEAKERLIKLGIEPDLITVVSNTLNLDKFRLNNRNTDNNFSTLVYVGGLNVHRGIQNVLKALVEVIRRIPKMRFWIVGEGSYKIKLIHLTKELKLEKNVKFWGWQNTDKISELLSKSDIALIPHLKSDHTDSTIPHKLFQYMYAQIPIIASDCEPIKRILNETNTGLIYESNNISQLTKTIIDLAENKEKYDSLIKNGKKAVLGKFNWNNDEKNLLAIFRVRK